MGHTACCRGLEVAGGPVEEGGEVGQVVVASRVLEEGEVAGDEWGGDGR